MDKRITPTPPQTRRTGAAQPVKALSPPLKPNAKVAKPAPALTPAPASSAGSLDTQFLESLLGYNARRAALVIIGLFLKRMAPYGLRPVDFSVLSVIEHNPGVTSRQLCAALSILPPNFVKLLGTLEQRKLVDRKPHPQDKRAAALHLTPQGHALVQSAEVTVRQLERQSAARLTQAEHTTLIRLLQKVYLP